MTVQPLPQSELKRLKVREREQRRQTRKMAETSKFKLKIETVSIEGLWLLSDGVCMCDDRCGPLNPKAKHGDPDHIVFGHLHARRFGGGHTIKNSALQRADCNQAATKHENNRKRVETKFTPDKSRPKKKPARPSSKLPTKADRERWLKSRGHSS